MKYNKGFGTVGILIALVVVAGVGFLAYSMGKNSNSTNTPVAPMYGNNNSSNNGGTADSTAHVLTQTEAEAVVSQTWGGCTPDSCAGPVTVTVQHNGNQYMVAAVYNGLYDDSARANQKEAVATYTNGVWVLGTPSVTWACQLNRGHSNFSTVACS